jgi:sigma-B regulation protein RsbU (phosphoserine phosphatase)
VLRGYLVVESEDRRVPVGAAIKIGRTRECGLIVEDSAASRMHLEIRARGNAYHWRDLGSSNGTVLNGARMLAGELKHGDRIQIGETVLRFELEELPEDPELEDTNLFNETILDLTGKEKKKPVPSKSLALLKAVYTVMNEIATNYEPCSLTDKILETTVRAINAQRGAVFLKGADDTLLPCPDCGKVHRIREGRLVPAEMGDIRVSTTVAKRVLGDGESVLYQDAEGDGELEASESILSLRLRSILCVPLRAKQGILGILYIDSDREDQAYSHDDLLLASAVGNSAGLALENARMHQQILEKYRIEQELNNAWTIQEGLLFQDWPEAHPGFQVFGETHPAKTVGGDLYDFLQIDADRVGLLIADVSGKGMPAALAMARLLGDFHLHARETGSPAEVLRQLNNTLARRSQRGMFCSMCYIMLHLPTGTLTFANAGHPPPLRIGPRGYEPLGGASGPPAGIVPEAVFTDEQATLLPGETVLLYTDGFVEARRAEPAEDGTYIEFGINGIAQAAMKHHTLAPHALLDQLLVEVEAYCTPKTPHDDCTLAALRYLGPVG